MRLFKHDFFAATALYERSDRPGRSDCGDLPVRVVLKLSRRADFLGIGLAWLGRAMSRHERAVLLRLRGTDGLPRFLSDYDEDGFFYEYIEGHSLDARPVVQDDFFEKLSDLLGRIHKKRIAYIDMNKRGNILVRDDGSPGLIDFQISLYIPADFLLFGRLFDRLLGIFQAEDRYHLLKHKRRIRSDLMDRAELELSHRVSFWIAFHRKVSWSLRRLRRNALGYLFRRDCLITDDISWINPEADPTRWTRPGRDGP